MATEKSNQLLKEENQLKRDSLKIDQDIRDFNRGSLDMSIASTESIKELLGVKTKLSEFDRLILKNSKDISNQLLGQASSLSDINSYRRDTLKNQRLLQKSVALENSMLISMAGHEQANIKALVKKSILRDTAVKGENELLLKQGILYEDLNKATLKGDKDQIKSLEEKIQKNNEDLVQRRNVISIQDEEINKLIEGRDKEGKFVKGGLKTDKQRLAFLQAYNTAQLKGSQDLRKETEALVEPASNFLSILGAIPGLGKIASGIESEITLEVEKQLELGNKNVTGQQIFNKALTKSFQNLVTIRSVGVAAIVALSKAFFELDSAFVASQRNIGETYDTSRNLSSEFSTVTDTLKIANNLVEQFGFNVNAAFSGETVLAASELVEAVGLTAEQAGQLAFFTEINGQNLNNSLDSAIKTINPLLSQRQILQQVGQVSSYIALNFDNQVESLIQAAAQAKELGLELNQVNKIADGLLDIESSIANEFQAELLTGKQLNLERARFFALTNDLAGLTGEIAKNQEIINAFETGGRIEQQAIAEALGLSADELSSMIQTQKALNNMTEEEREAKRLADLKSLELQERFGKLLSTLAQESVVILEPLVTGFKIIAGITKYVIEGFKTLKPIIAAAAIGATGLGLAMLAAGAATITLSSFLNPFGAALATIASLTAIGFMKSEFNKAKTVGDAIIPAGKGPIISTREGGLIQGTANDDVIMAPGIARGGRNTGLSQADITAIAKAVRDGASQAQINLDGGRVSNRLQPSLAVNTRRYSI